MFKILGLVIGLFSVSLVHADSSKTAYETLIGSYQSSTQPAKLTDFKVAATVECAVVRADKPDEVTVTNAYVRCGTVLVPAKPAQDIPAVPAKDIPAHGPLIPARHIPEVPAKHIPAQAEVCQQGSEKLLLGRIGISPTPKQLEVFSVQTTATDLVVSVAKNTQGIYADIGDDVRILFRSQLTYFPFIFTTSKGANFAGYCYYSWPAP